MLRKVFCLGCLATGLWLAQGVVVDAQQADGPVREGLRRTGQAVGEGTRAAARATGEAVRRTGEAARETARGTANAGRRLTGREPINSRQGTENYQGQANYDNQQRYETGYRGTQQGAAQGWSQAEYRGPVYRLHHDRLGREFICVNGRRVYFDNRSPDVARSPARPEPHRAARPMDDGRMIESEENQAAQQGAESSETYDSDNANAPPPAPDAQQSTSGSANEQNTQRELSAEADAEADLSGSDAEGSRSSQNQSDSE